MTKAAATPASTRPVPRGRTAPDAKARPEHSAPVNPVWELMAWRAQTKLALSRPDDPAEREADRIAERITRVTQPQVQRQCTACAADGAPCPACEQQAVARRAADGAAPPARAPDGLAQALGAGRTLEPAVRTFFEPRLGQDLRDVSVHTGSAADAAARALKADAFTVGSHIAFRDMRFSPGSSPGRRLLAHELAHVIQQRGGSAEPAAMIQRSAASDLIDSHTSWGNLDEEALGAELLRRITSGALRIVEEVLDALGWTDRDDVAYELTRRAGDTELDRMAASADGRRVLDRLYDEMTGGSVSEEETVQANRILAAKTRRITPEEFAAGMAGAKIFPYRLPGLTVFNDAPIIAERRSGGRVWVRQPVRVLGTDEFRADTRTLPSRAFTSGIELPENEVVGVHMYDLGGVVHYRPALYLVQLANETTTTVYQKIGEAAALGLTLGSGAVVGGGAELGLGARALLWADRAAFALGTLTSVIGEHRGWILERFGASGAAFLRYVDMVNSAVVLYGGVRAVVGVAQLVNGLRRSYTTWRAAADSVESELSASQRTAVREIGSQTDEFLRNADEAAAHPTATPSAAPSAVAGAAPEPAPAPARTPRVASGTPEPPEPLLPGGTLAPRQADLLTRLGAADELGAGLLEVGRREVTATDLAALTRHTHREFALVILRDNRRVLVDMGSYRGGALPPNTRTLLMHSHPTDWGSGMSRFVSQEDVEALLMLNQRYSYMVTVDGTVYRFTFETVPMTVGEIVRRFHPILGWVRP
jgi:hypothetical protein